MAESGDVAILGGRISLAEKSSCRAGLRIVGPESSDEGALEVSSPEVALATLIRYLASAPIPDDWLSPDETAKRFGEVARFGRIHRSASIGTGCTLGAGVVIHASVSIGPGCVLCDHAVVGSPGFGLHRPPPVALRQAQEPPVETSGPPVETRRTTSQPTRLILLPHRAGVVLEDDVFLGPHVNVAAGLIEPTMIGTGCRIDALVQIGHNARIGACCVFAGQSGVAGSAELGADCMVGGQAAISDHVRLGARCVVAARAGVTKSWGDGVTLRGFPARPGLRNT